MRKKKQKLSSFLLQKKFLLSYLAVAILIVILAISLKPQLTGSAIYDALPSMKTIAVEDGASADDIVAISLFATKQGIRETMLTSELTGAEENVIIFQNVEGDSTTISLSGKNIVVEGDVEQATSVLLASDNYYDPLSQYDTLEIVDGQIVVPETEEIEAEEITSALQNNCVDSDGGDNPYVYGKLTGTDAYGNVIDQPDECGVGTATINDVFEKVCTDTSYTYTQHSCEYGCENGACNEGEEEYTGILCSQIPYNSLSVTKNSITIHFYEYGLYLCDASSDIPVVLVEQYGGGNYPSLSDSGDYVAYFQNYGIYLYEISTGEKTQIEQTNSNYPTVSDNYVAYFKEYGIYVYDIETGEKYEIEPPNSGCGWQPTISGTTLFYKCNYEDRTYDLSTLETVVVLQNNCVDSDGGDEPYIYGTLTGTDADGNVILQTDQCGSGTTINDVFEKVCTDTSYTYTQHSCEYGCENGACIEELEVAESVCGNGVVDAEESCDDGNTEDGDGCTADCVLEAARGCTETDTGISGTFTGYYYDYYQTGQEYSYDYSYDNYCYYDSYSATYYYINYYCDQSLYDSRWYPASTATQCPSSCEDAEGCIEVEIVEPSCTDSDSADENTFGTTVSVNRFGEEKTIEDSCYSYSDDYHYVIEGYCSDAEVYTKYILCDGVCQEGVCIEAQEAVCEDSDNTDMYSPTESSLVFGEVSGTDRSGNEFTKTDECYGSYGHEYVIEQYCNEQDVPTTTWVYCRGGCEDGLCQEPDWEQSCTDSDATTTNAGRDIYTLGTASGIDYYGQEYTYTDYCYYNSWNKKYYVADYYCIENEYYGMYTESYYDYCPAGCTNGACDVSATTATPTCTAAGTGVTGTDQYGNAYTYADICTTMETLLDYSCGTGSDDAPYIATETACNCVEGACVEASMTVAEFLSSATDVTIVIGASAATEDNIAAIDLAGAYGWVVVKDATISDFTSQNIVAVGGPYANAASREALGGEVWDYQPGQALFFLKEYDAGGATLVISGSEAMDTRNAVKLVINDPSSLAYDYGVEQVS